MWSYHRVLQLIKIRIFLVGFLIVTAFVVSAGRKSDAALSSDTIRVAIAKNAQGVTVDGEGLLAVRESGAAVAVKAPVTVKASRGEVAVDGVTYRRLVFSAASAVQINGKPYRGIAEISFSDKGLVVVNELPLEDYLVGLINCEISSAWPIEAIKAQAVIARTYAINRREARRNALYHLESSVIDQVYNGCEIEDSRARRGVSETAGEVLTYEGAVIQAFYHSNCGGKTEAAENVWGASIPYLKGVDCQYCLLSSSSSWDQRLPLRELEGRLRAAGFKAAGLTDIRGGARNNRGRLKTVIAVVQRGDIAITGDQFRKAVGYGVIKSTNFTVKVVNGDAVFSGLGNGHGVGLCQWGAKQRALEGFSYAEILSYYYPGTELKMLSDIR
ncbi:SpoIID/LytB domain-containing protein [Oryzomonas japonica]|uniref:SpoIID/LytB domain-containing protein n=1 Tax=Oryzomonas japonica TaxID=2603858 RepID=A0A7J4ZU09_9BACT|nr:SpoIID/LytB domain-containing protein [Oryzomonas japonica]KAB0666912.1 SpoIID/LytB domain-containing protein [Oryzomonas japonica]